MKNSILKTSKYVALGLVGVLAVLISIIVGAGYLAKLPDTALTPAGHSRNISKYLTMPDGVKIAVDIWFPKEMSGTKRYPTAMTMTRYWRASNKTVLQRGLIVLGLGSENDILDVRTSWFNEAGYVVIHVDARGTGASFGARSIEWSPDEISDYGEILKWIGEQPWSNGNVGSYGISYAGNTAEMIMINGRPELKLAAPLYNDFNPFLGLVQPGGAQNSYLDGWASATRNMDQNKVCGVAGVEGMDCWLVKSMVTGVKPVQGQEDQLEQALEDHKKNFLMLGSNKNQAYLDDTYGVSGYTTGDIAPFGHRRKIEASGVPMVLHTGWHDAATVEGALRRFRIFSNDQHLLIGPFSHGGRTDTDPFKDVASPVSPSSKEQYDQLIGYFDKFLKEGQVVLSPHKQITYYTLGADKWSTTEVWPPAGFERKTYYFDEGQKLRQGRDNIAVSNSRYTVDFSATSGNRTRWHTNFGGGDVVYSDRLDQDKKLLTYTTGPLEEAIEITGTPVISLHVSSSHPDNMFIVYLEDIAPDGQVTYITEGVIRADNRALGGGQRDGVAHSYLRKDARPMVVGEMTEVSFNLQPISVQIKSGHRLRVAIGGADKGMFRRWPEAGVPEWTIYQGGAAASGLIIPYKILK